MNYTETTVNLRKFTIGYFESIDEALKVLPADVVLFYVNSAWHNTQVLKLSDALQTHRPKW